MELFINIWYFTSPMVSPQNPSIFDIIDSGLFNNLPVLSVTIRVRPKFIIRTNLFLNCCPLNILIKLSYWFPLYHLKSIVVIFKISPNLFSYKPLVILSKYCRLSICILSGYLFLYLSFKQCNLRKL